MLPFVLAALFAVSGLFASVVLIRSWYGLSAEWRSLQWQLHALESGRICLGYVPQVRECGPRPPRAALNSGLRRPVNPGHRSRPARRAAA